MKTATLSLCLVFSLLPIGYALAADTPITGLRLGTNLNAGGFIITNLGPGFAEANGLATGPVVRVESDPSALPIATNALTNAWLALGMALSRSSPGDVSNIVSAFVSSWSPSAVVGSAGGLLVSNYDGWARLSVGLDSVLLLEWSINTDTAIVTAVYDTPGSYTGPALGTRSVSPWAFSEDRWLASDDGAGYYELLGSSNDVHAPFTWTWGGGIYIGGGTLPGRLYHGEGETETSFVVDWLKSAGTNTYPLSSLTTNAPSWIAATNTATAITLTNNMERPLYVFATGAVTLAFAGLRPPQPVYLVLKGPDSVTFPSNTHFVGGASWQTNQANHFVVWQYGTNLFCNPVTTSED